MCLISSLTNALRSAKNIAHTSALVTKFFSKGIYYKKTISDPLEWRRKAIQLTHDQTTGFLNRIHFDVEKIYSHPDLFANGKKYFMVANHMSYMDLLFLGTGEPAVFVTSVEMKNTPFLGPIAEYGGSYFVERRDRNKIPGEIKDLSALMQSGFNVFVFPEATSTHGMHILPFKRAMFSAAVDAGIDVLPICLRYEMIDGEPFNENNKDRICWYGSMPFVPHFTQAMSIRSMKATVTYLDPISTKEFPDRRVVADKAYEQITKHYFSNRDSSFKPWPVPEKKSQGES